MLHCNKADCRPEFLAKADGRVRAAYKLKIEINNIPNLTATFDLMVGLPCDVARKKVEPTVSISDFRLHLPSYGQIPFLAGIIESELTQRALPVVDRTIKDKLREFVNGLSFAAQVCPRTIAKSGGALILDFTAGTQCTQGQKRDLPCGGRMTGTIHQVCSNGWWRDAGAACLEPKPPDFLDQP